MKYTEKLHAQGLLLIFSEDISCLKCPKTWIARKIGTDFQHCLTSNMAPTYCATICNKFIGLKVPKKKPICPCNRLGPAKATKKTWLALEKKGYL